MSAQTASGSGRAGGEYLAGTRYFDPTFAAEAVKVLPGEYFVTGADMVLVTVLGSCVSACIRDPDRGVGGLNHFMLAEPRDVGARSASARYGGYAMEVLINRLLKSGARRHRLEAKVFGGGAVIAGFDGSLVGDANARFVLDYLATEGIPVLAHDLLGRHARKVYYFPRSGRVLVRKLVHLPNDTLARREKEYAARLREAPQGGEIELFT